MLRKGFVRARIDDEVEIDEDIDLDKKKAHTIEIVVPPGAEAGGQAAPHRLARDRPEAGGAPTPSFYMASRIRTTSLLEVP